MESGPLSERHSSVPGVPAAPSEAPAGGGRACPLSERAAAAKLHSVNVPRQRPPNHVNVPPPPPTLAPNVPTSGGGGGTYVRAERPNVSGNVQRQRGQATSLDTDAHAPHSASELAPGAAVG